jgi:hypothetical protein
VPGDVRYEALPKVPGTGAALFLWRKGRVARGVDQLEGVLQLQERRKSVEGPLTLISGRMFCDPGAPGPYPYRVLAADVGKEGWIVLEGPSEAVEAWTSEFRLLLGN